MNVEKLKKGNDLIQKINTLKKQLNGFENIDSVEIKTSSSGVTMGNFSFNFKTAIPYEFPEMDSIIEESILKISNFLKGKILELEKEFEKL